MNPEEEKKSPRFFGGFYLFVAMTIWCIQLSYCSSLLGTFFRRRELGVLDCLLKLSIPVISNVAYAISLLLSWCVIKVS